MPHKRDLGYLLSNKYDPASDTPSRFLETYHQLAKHRDDLRDQCNAKEQKPSATASEVKGSRFSGLPDNDNGSMITPPIKHKFPASLATAQIEQLTNDQRKQEVIIFKRDIQALKEEKEMKRDTAAAESKQKRVREEAKRKKEQEEAEKEDQDDASESELGQGLETAKR